MPAEKIRDAIHQTAETITIYIRTKSFDKNRKYYSNSINIDLPIPTNNGLGRKKAIDGLKKIYKCGYFSPKSWNCFI